MSTKVEFFNIEYWPEIKQSSAGTIEFKDGKLVSKPTKDNEYVLKNIMKTESYVGDRTLTSDKNPEAWLKSLPNKYQGSCLRAGLVADKKATKESALSTEPQQLQKPRTANYPTDKSAHAVATGKRNSPRGLANNKREQL